MKTTTLKFETREQYLQAAIVEMKPLFDKAGAPLPTVYVSTGWPSGRPSEKCKVLGECWDKSTSADKLAHIFISPWIGEVLHALGTKDAKNPTQGDGMGVLPTLAHEMVHAAVGNKEGHGPVFRKVATAIGLEGKMTSTNAGQELLETLHGISEKLGPYPHAKLQPSLRTMKKKQGTRMIKCECADCGYTVRTTKKWLEVGVPECPAGHGDMAFEMPQD